MYYAIRNVFIFHQPMTMLADQWTKDEELYDDSSALGLFIDNHDTHRFLNESGNEVMLKNALTFIFTAKGIPVMYYGTEQNL